MSAAALTPARRMLLVLAALLMALGTVFAALNLAPFAGVNVAALNPALVLGAVAVLFTVCFTVGEPVTPSGRCARLICAVLMALGSLYLIVLFSATGAAGSGPGALLAGLLACAFTAAYFLAGERMSAVRTPRR